MKGLLILKCNDPMRWYSHLVGTIVDFLAEEEIEYKSLEPAGYVNFVLKEDAKVVDICYACGTHLKRPFEIEKELCYSCYKPNQENDYGL